MVIINSAAEGEASEEMRDLTDGLRRGFGSLRVHAVVGGSAWMTSIFPDSARNAYVLPIGATSASGRSQRRDIATVELVDR